MGADITPIMADKVAYCALVHLLLVSQGVLVQIILPCERFVAKFAREILLAVRRLVFSQGGVFAERFPARLALVRRLFGVTTVVRQEFGFVAQGFTAQAARFEVEIFVEMRLQADGVEELFLADFALRFAQRFG